MRWLLTYADLITLLMVFFIVMYAMSSVNAEKYEQLAYSLKISLMSGGYFPGGIPGMPAKPPPPPPEDQLQKVGEEVAGELSRENLGQVVSVFLNERGLTLSFAGSVLFDRGYATIRPDGEAILGQVAGVLEQLPNPISVEGSTDDLPVSTEQFPSNWELSVRRATNVIRYFIDRHGLPPTRFMAVGYGEFHPMFPNDTEEDRARNRWGDIVILRSSIPVGAGKPVC